jgi:heterodisulfide reductase subunit C
MANERPVAEKGEHIIARHLIDDDAIKEEKNLVIDGVDVSGRWNTFIETRVDSDYDRSFFNEIKKTVVGSRINRCWQCGMCTASCTVTPIHRRFNPRAFIYMMQLGNLKELKKYIDVAWRCVGCYKCSQRCPKQVNPAEMMEALALLIKKYFPEEVESENKLKIDEDVKKIYDNMILRHGRLDLAKLHTSSMNKMGRMKELFNKVEMGAILKMIMDGRAFSVLRLGKPYKWGKSRKAIENYLKNIDTIERSEA